MVDFSVSRAIVNKRAYFLNLSIGGSKEYEWLVNDITISTKTHTSFHFHTPGVNHVTLIVKGENGKQFSKTKEVVVYNGVKKKVKWNFEKIKNTEVNHSIKQALKGSNKKSWWDSDFGNAMSVLLILLAVIVVFGGICFIGDFLISTLYLSIGFGIAPLVILLVLAKLIYNLFFKEEHKIY